MIDVGTKIQKHFSNNDGGDFKKEFESGRIDIPELVRLVVEQAHKKQRFLKVVFKEPVPFTGEENLVVELTGLVKKPVWSFYNEDAGDTYVQFLLDLGGGELIEVPLSTIPEQYLANLVILPTKTALLENN